MQILEKFEGKLKMSVSSEGNYIPLGTSVVIETVVDDFKNIFLRVSSIREGSVILPYVETNISWLV
jgi:hypothetical protein